MAAKRVQGYFVRVDYFVPVDMKDRDRARSILDGIDALQASGNTDILRDIGAVVLAHSAKFTTKEIEDAPLAPAASTGVDGQPSTDDEVDPPAFLRKSA
jgi:hypothetical protein